MNAIFFKHDATIAQIFLSEVVSWTKEGSSSRLFLPPIQRSVVWRNSQIINFWDSLLRGYPAGLMMLHRPKKDALQVQTTDGNMCAIDAEDFLLFDGQQRLTAILLGLGEGKLKNNLKLWVDLGCEMPPDSNLLYLLRINSIGQPFGYMPKLPNEKLPLDKRREKAFEWMNRTGADRFHGKQAFKNATGKDLIDAHCAIPLSEIVGLILIRQLEADDVVKTLSTSYPTIQVERLWHFVYALNKALKTPITFQLIDQCVIERQDEYIRFFGRLGQGGTPLSNDELTYSVIKYHFPEVHERMKEITDGPAGQIASEVHLVLAALRVAKVSAPWNNSGEWEIYGRPFPAFVSRLKEHKGVCEVFQQMIPQNSSGRLVELLESMRHRLVYDHASNPNGLPVILLARLPHQLVEVLILMQANLQSNDDKIFLPAFVLYWLLFVCNSEKAADTIFQRFCKKDDGWQPCSDKQLIRYFEEQGIARRLPGRGLLHEAQREILQGDHTLRAWRDRFTALDANKDHPSGDALRVLSTHGELIRITLLWLQREYLAEKFPDFDPTSNHDEDLPIDLDHLIPHIKFGAHWTRQQSRLNFIGEKDNFRNLRWTVGNSLGNYRWLDASENRGRGGGEINLGDGKRDFIDEVQNWNALIEKKDWDEHDVANFQKYIDTRSLYIYKFLLLQSGIDKFVTEDIL